MSQYECIHRVPLVTFQSHLACAWNALQISHLNGLCTIQGELVACLSITFAFLSVFIFSPFLPGTVYATVQFSANRDKSGFLSQVLFLSSILSPIQILK